MTFLVADIGGTNSRLALVRGDGILQVERFPNDGFRDFYDLLDRFLAQHPTVDIRGGCIALAGPVDGTEARLTNRDWSFNVAEIARKLRGTRPGAVSLINDLAALGHAVPVLSPAQVSDVRPVRPPAAENGQALVAGLGTGFNVCLVKGDRPAPMVLEAEHGHASLPTTVSQLLGHHIGGSAAEFTCCEALFSGAGLVRLHALLSGEPNRDGRDILRAATVEGTGSCVQTTEIFAELLGTFARELVSHYLPLNGIYFAGSVARGILASQARVLALTAFQAPGTLEQQRQHIPIRVITDDAAALMGAARVFTQGRPKAQ